MTRWWRRGFNAIPHCPHCQQPLRWVRHPDFALGWMAFVLAAVILFGSFGWSVREDYATSAEFYHLQQRLVLQERWREMMLVAEPPPHPEHRKWAQPRWGKH